MKKGFTLVELLAVIIILGILSVLIVPKVVNTLNESEEKTNMASAEGLLKAAEYKYQGNEIKGISENVIIDYTNNENTDKLDFSGKKPEKGTVDIRSNGAISIAVKIGGKCYKKNFGESEFNVEPYNEETCAIKVITIVDDVDENETVSAGDEIAIGNEHFYVISINSTNLKLLSKYNLNVGNILTECNEENNWECNVTPISASTPDYGIQSEDAFGYIEELAETGTIKGTIAFSTNSYWTESFSLKSTYGNDFPAYVYDSNSPLYEYVENYVDYLKKIGAPYETTGRLVSLDDLAELGCSQGLCNSSTKPWVYSTSYWTGAAYSHAHIYTFTSLLSENVESVIDPQNYDYDDTYGVRPVIETDPNEL